MNSEEPLMNPLTFEQHVRDEAHRFAFISNAVTSDRTANTVKLQLFITPDCFVQVYTNLRKGLLSYTLVLHQARIYGRDTEGADWHRTPPLPLRATISARRAPAPFRWPSFSTRFN
jgi:hypothetical protein